MPVILDKDLYKIAKQKADEIYEKSSAYKSGYIVKKYKELGGRYADDKSEKKLSRWYKEEWRDIGGLNYPVFRPTVKINKSTPLTPKEIDDDNLKEQILIKQIIKGDANLKPFKGKGINNNNLISALKIPKSDDIWNYSNPITAQKKAFNYLGENAVIYKSIKPKKKFMIFDPNNNKWIHFGQMGWEDYNFHKNFNRMKRYRARSSNIKGNWRDNPYSANNLSINILW